MGIFRKTALGVLIISVIFPVLLIFFTSSLCLRMHIYETATNPHLGELDPPRDLSEPKWKIFKHFKNPKVDVGLDYEKVEFNSWKDPNTKLRGWFIPSQDDYTISSSDNDPNVQRVEKARVGVVMVHGAFVDRREFIRHTKWLHDYNLNLLLFDCREHGASDGTDKGVSLTVREHEDALAAVHYMKKQRRMDRIILLGISQGGASVIHASGVDNEGLIDMVIAEAPFSERYGLLKYSYDLALHKGWAGFKISDTLLGRIGLGLLDADWFKDAVVGLGMYRMGALKFKDILSPGKAKQLIENPIDVVDRISPRPLLLIHAIKDHIVLLDESKKLYEKAKEPKQLKIFERGIHDDILNEHGEEYQDLMLGFIRKYLK